jgi:hypothetical protein
MRPRLIALIAIGTLLLQTFAAGVAGAYAVSAPADTIGVICHGAAGDRPADTPDSGKAAPDCCIFCTATSAGIVNDAIAVRYVPRAVPASRNLSGPVIVIARTAVRAGRSQAPPSLG